MTLARRAMTTDAYCDCYSAIPGYPTGRCVGCQEAHEYHGGHMYLLRMMGTYLCTGCLESATLQWGWLDGQRIPASTCCGEPVVCVGDAPPPIQALRQAS